MAAAVMTRPTSNKPAMSSTSQHKTRIPPKLQLNNGAASSSSSSSLASLSSSSSPRDASAPFAVQSCSGEDSRFRSSTHSGVRIRDRDRGGRERSSRLVVNGELVESQLSPRTQESIFQVFSFDTKTAEFEESVSQMWPHRCSFIVKELIETERTYVEALGDIIKGYITPLYSYLLSSGDGPNFIQTVFSNIVKIHSYHLDLLDSFQSLCSQPRQLTQLFLDRDFALYTEYCTNYAKGNDYLEQSLANSSDLQAFILDCQSKLDHSLPLHSHLIKPVQRILKYPLLLEELVKNFDDTHPAFSTVEDACRKMTKVAEHINSSFQKPAKKSRLAPSAIAKIRSKEVEGLQRRRTMAPLSPNSPTSSRFLALGHFKRSLSVEPGDLATTDRVHLRNRRRRKNRKKHGRRHMSVEDLCPDEHATTSSSEEDHLARVSELRSFFENLNSSDIATAAKAKSPVMEVAPLQASKLSVFENPSNSDEGKRNGYAPEEMTANWPSVRKTSCKFASSSATESTTSGSAKPKSSGKEQGMTKRNRRKRDS